MDIQAPGADVAEGNEAMSFMFGNINVRAYYKDGQPVFIADDLKVPLGITNMRQALSRLDGEEKGVILNDTPGGRQKVSVVNEYGLYSLILGSRKEEAKVFKRWIVREVIPEIRRTGGYTTRQAAEGRRRPGPPYSEEDRKDMVNAVNDFITYAKFHARGRPGTIFVVLPSHGRYTISAYDTGTIVENSSQRTAFLEGDLLGLIRLVNAVSDLHEIYLSEGHRDILAAVKYPALDEIDGNFHLAAEIIDVLHTKYAAEMGAILDRFAGDPTSN